VTTVYKVRANRDLHPADPLHVCNFYPDKQRRHRSKMQDRQDLILYLAQLHATAVKHCAISNKPRAFCEVPFRLMTLRDWVHDYRVVLDYFFEVKQIGFNFGEGAHEVSTLIPKNIEYAPAGGRNFGEGMIRLGLLYVPPERPDDGTISKVHIQQQNAETIRLRLAEENRADLRAATDWLLRQTEVNFIFQRSGKLQQRDTSVWPVAAIETWPAWLREQLFGPGIDIEAAYTQYLLSQLQRTESEERILLFYPDIVRSVKDKQAFRQELCALMGLQWTDENISIVKKLCMSLANGSRISPAILSGNNGFSVTADLVIQATDDLSVENLDAIGMRLRRISRQYSDARRLVCITQYGLHPSRTNQKLVFSGYFEWERQARYAIWKEVGHHGIMVHDGIDGVPQEYLDNLPALMQKIGLKVTT
jgi:hypothetical protein